MLEVQGLRKVFNPGEVTEVRALDGVDLTVPEGSWTMVIGGNGSGKSTLLNAVAGSFPLDAGRIRVGGVEVSGWPEWKRARLVGRVFQDPFAGTAPSLTVAENMALADRRGRSRGLGWLLHRRDRDRFRQTIAALGLGLEQRLDQPIGTMSGGQRQSMTLAMATLRPPRLLLLDEHTAALDPRSADLVIQATRRVVETHRLTTLMVTHSMTQAAELGDRLVVMHRGRVERVYDGAQKRRLRPETLVELFAELRMQDDLDDTVAAMLAAEYAEPVSPSAS